MVSQQLQGRRGERVTAEERNHLRALAEERGVNAVARDFGLSPAAVLRAVSGLPVLPGTLLMLRAGLERADDIDEDEDEDDVDQQYEVDDVDEEGDNEELADHETDDEDS